jgi:hypothetical protein
MATAISLLAVMRNCPDTAILIMECDCMRAEVVRRRFGVEYTLAGLDLLLHRIGWSVQVPARQASERDEAAIAAWKEATWPVIKGRWRTWAPGWSSRTNPARA